MFRDDHHNAQWHGFLRAGALVALLILAGCGGEGDPRSSGGLVEGGDSAATEVAEPGGPSSSGATPGTEPSAPSGDESTTGAEDPAPRVVFLGTSLTAGLGLERPADRWPEQVALLADSAGLEMEVVNAGVSGDTSAGGLRRLNWLLSEPVDLLVVELGANDGLRGQSPEALEENLTTIIERTRERWPGARVVLAGMEAPPNLGAEYVERFREVYPRVAEETGATLVPFLLDGVAGVPALNQADGIHPTPEGHHLMARNAWPLLRPILVELNRGSATP